MVWMSIPIPFLVWSLYAILFRPRMDIGNGFVEPFLLGVVVSLCEVVRMVLWNFIPSRALALACFFITFAVAILMVFVISLYTPNLPE